jgi:hypothetical protein
MRSLTLERNVKHRLELRAVNLEEFGSYQVQRGDRNYKLRRRIGSSLVLGIKPGVGPYDRKGRSVCFRYVYQVNSEPPKGRRRFPN